MTQLRNFCIGNTTAEESLFFYEAGVNHSSFINPSFEPLFEPPPADENVTRMCRGSAQCVFDYTVTGKKSLALASAVAATQHQTLVESLKTGKQTAAQNQAYGAHLQSEGLTSSSHAPFRTRWLRHDVNS